MADFLEGVHQFEPHSAVEADRRYLGRIADDREQLAEQFLPVEFMTMKFLDADELEAGLAEILASPDDDGVVRMITRRPEIDQREMLDAGQLDVADGLVGDNWRAREPSDEGRIGPSGNAAQPDELSGHRPDRAVR